MLKKCLDDSDDEVRERAYFYIVLIEQDMKDSVLQQNMKLSDQEEDEDDADLLELRNFVFDEETNINVDALEAYLNANKQDLCEQEDELDINIESMMVKGKVSASVNSSFASTNSDSSVNQQSPTVAAKSNNN